MAFLTSYTQSTLHSGSTVDQTITSPATVWIGSKTSLAEMWQQTAQNKPSLWHHCTV